MFKGVTHKKPSWAFLAHDNFCTVRARSDGQNEARTSSYFSTMAAEHSPHRSTRIKFELVYISGEKPSTACPFLRAEGTRTLTYRAEVTNWRTCGRENVSVNSYVTETKAHCRPRPRGVAVRPDDLTKGGFVRHCNPRLHKNIPDTTFYSCENATIIVYFSIIF